MRVPPGVSPDDFAKAIAEFKRIVGAEWVFTTDEDVDLYRDAYSIVWGTTQERIASAALCPTTVEQVQRIVRIANTYKIPLYPISTGRNLGYGGTAPAYSGSVVLDLKRMNRVLEVNEERGFVLVEPGVSYFDLYRHFQDNHVRMLVDLPGPAWGSLIGNALDHGAGYLQAQYRNHFDSHCGMEVVLPNGELLRTGMGALPSSNSWQDFKYGVGPWIDGIFSQSNYGIVTKMGFWVMPEPDAFFYGTVYAYRREDLNPLIAVLNYLENTGVTTGIPFMGSPLYGGSTFLPRDPQVVEYVAKMQHEPTEEQLQTFARERNVAYWSLQLKFYGAEKALRENWEYCKSKFAEKIAGATFEDGQMWKFPLKPDDIPNIHKPQFGVPSLERFTRGARTKTNPVPDWGHIFFSPVIPRTGEAVFKANEVIAKILSDYGLVENQRRVRFNLPSLFWNRTFVLLYGFSVKRDPEKDKRTLEGVKALIAEGAKHGWGEYRAAVAVHDDVMSAYSFNDHALLRFNETLKDAIDPNGIISAGRYGIWPKHLRKNV